MSSQCTDGERSRMSRSMSPTSPRPLPPAPIAGAAHASASGGVAPPACAPRPASRRRAARRRVAARRRGGTLVPCRGRGVGPRAPPRRGRPPGGTRADAAGTAARDRHGRWPPPLVRRLSAGGDAAGRRSTAFGLRWRLRPHVEVFGGLRIRRDGRHLLPRGVSAS